MASTPIASYNPPAQTLWPIKPRALQGGNKTFFAYGNYSSNQIEVAEFVHSTGLWAVGAATAWSMQTTRDSHCAPTMAADSAGYIRIVMGAYQGSGDYIITKETSNNNYNISAWTTSTFPRNEGGGHAYTYCLPEFGTSDSNIALLYRRDASAASTLTQFRLIKSTDGGSTWPIANDIAVIDGLNNNVSERPYAYTCMDGNTLYVAWHQDNVTANQYQGLYLIYTDNPFDAVPSWKDMAGNSVSVPISTSTNSDIRIFDSVGNNWDNCYIGHIGVDDLGTPHVAYGLGDATKINRLIHATWNGSSWTNTVVKEDNGLNALYPGQICDATIRVKNSNQISIATPKIVSTKAEMYEYHTNDGSSWTETALTSGSTNHNVLPIYPRNVDAENCRLLYMKAPNIAWNQAHTVEGFAGEIFSDVTKLTPIELNTVSLVDDDLDIVELS